MPFCISDMMLLVVGFLSWGGVERLEGVRKMDTKMGAETDQCES